MGRTMTEDRFGFSELQNFGPLDTVANGGESVATSLAIAARNDLFFLKITVKRTGMMGGEDHFYIPYSDASYFTTDPTIIALNILIEKIEEKAFSPVSLDWPTRCYYATMGFKLLRDLGYFRVIDVPYAMTSVHWATRDNYDFLLFKQTWDDVAKTWPVSKRALLRIVDVLSGLRKKGDEKQPDAPAT